MVDSNIRIKHIYVTTRIQKYFSCLLKICVDMRILLCECKYETTMVNRPTQ